MKRSKFSEEQVAFALRQERDFLKKATAYFANPSP